MITDGLSEQEILQKLAEGNQEAFRAIFMRYYPKIRGFVFGLLKSDDDAEDVTQEIFARVWLKRESFAEVRNVGVYLFVLSRNMTYSYLEQKNARWNSLEYVPLDEIDDHNPLDDLVAKDIALLIDMVVEGMPPQRKLIYKLSRDAGISNSEIAERLHLSKKTIENHLNLALKELRNALFLLGLIFYLC